MTVIRIQPLYPSSMSASLAEPECGAMDMLSPLRELMLGTSEPLELPELVALVSALLVLAEGRRRKMLLALAGSPAEVALVRRGSSVLVSYYGVESSPDVWVLDRRVPLRALLDSAALALDAESMIESDPIARQRGSELVRRSESTQIAMDSDTGVSATRRLGGAVEDPGERPQIAFGFEAAIFPQAEPTRDPVSHADVHATLFGGQLWAWVRGRRIPLARGAIFLAVQRMTLAVRALIEAWECDRAANVRLRSGSFIIGVRREKNSEISVTLGSEEDGSITIPALDIEQASLPILRVASDLVRAIVSVDRSQSRNLRVTTLREEVRRLRRLLRARLRASSVVNHDPERLRSSMTSDGERRAHSAALSRPPRELRFVRRWSAAVDGLDASSTFLCGDRIVVATSRRVMALCRDSSDVLWSHEGPAAQTVLSSSGLLRIGADGALELRDVADGELSMRSKIGPRLGGPAFARCIEGGGLPPTVLVAEGRDRLSAIDLRTGEPRWRFSGRGAGAFELSLVGRIVLVVQGDHQVQAIDATNGEVVWRHAGNGRICFAPAVVRELALVVVGEPGRGESTLLGLELYTGRLRFKKPLAGAALAGPIATGESVVVAMSGPRRGTLASYRAESGEDEWSIVDPGVGVGGAVLPLDHRLIINSPRGTIIAVDPKTGELAWMRSLAHPVSDDVPRRLDPVLRGGALFVPSAAVHVLKVGDGSSIGTPLPCDLVPDVMRVDERGWVYVAEESGHLSALAPAPQLTLVR